MSKPHVPTSFETELLSYLNALYAGAYRFTRNRDTASDLVQDTCVKALRFQHQYQAGTNLKAWLFRILSTTYFNQYKRGSLEKNITEGPEAEPIAEDWLSTDTLRQLRDPESSLLKPIFQAELKKALDALPEEYRLTVIFADVEEFTYEEIAEMMACPLGTVMSRLHRGRKLLQKSLFHQAEALGFTKNESTKTSASSPPSPSHEPLNFEQFRLKKQGAA